MLAAAAAIAAMACGTAKNVRSMFGGQLPIEVSVAADCNEDSPVAVDFLVVYDQKVLDAVMKMTSADWFSKREQFEKDYPNEVALVKREWVPGQQVEPVTLTYHLGARKVVVFADYHTDGEHRVAAEPQERFRLVLGAADVARKQLHE